jgi:Leucine rich repeat/Leucine Rich repeats (2 copies)
VVRIHVPEPQKYQLRGWYFCGSADAVGPDFLSVAREGRARAWIAIHVSKRFLPSAKIKRMIKDMDLRFAVALMSIVLLAGAGCFRQPSIVVPASSGTATAETVVASGSSLDLSGRGLTSVSSDVFDMTGLETLDLSNNSLTGALPAEIRFLQSLQSLDASDNAMTGVPAEIGQLSALQYLDLSNNELTGLPNELGNLTSLVRLDLRGNTVSTQDLDGIRAKLVDTEILVD